jgi:chemotaxis protein MotB
MALSRRRDSNLIWPGFVDAVTTLLMVLMFVLTIFTVMQSVLRDTITTQGTELDALTAQVAGLADALGLERQKVGSLETEVGSLRASLSTAQAEGDRKASLITDLQGQLAGKGADLAAAQTRITSFEAQVATLLADRDTARGQIAELNVTVDDLNAARAKLVTEKDALDLALAKARTEIDASAEAARLAAAKREALETLIASLQAESATRQTDLNAARTALSDAEAAQLVDKAALDALRTKLLSADAELTSMTLALEEQRKRAEETLTLLAAANTKAAQEAAGQTESTDLLATAQNALAAESEKALAAAREVALLNEQVSALRLQLGSLQALLDASDARDVEADVQIDALGSQLNSALAQVAATERRRAELEAAERKRLEEQAKNLQAETQDLARFRSEFFGQLSTVLAGREGVRIVGDRFVFSSEVLFPPASADLSPEGEAQIAKVTTILNEIRDKIPQGIDWVIRVDGHTDNTPLSGTGIYADNWELSQARALSVVRYMQDGLGFPPDRLAATGFGEFRPVATGDSPQALAQNRRIELKLTER